MEKTIANLVLTKNYSMDKQKRIILAFLLLAIAFGNYIRNTANSNIRSVDFVSIFILGLIAGGFVYECYAFFKKKE